MVRYKSWTLLFSCWVVSNSFVTLWTVAHQARLSMGLPRQEYWMGCHAFLQGIFLTQGSAGRFFTTQSSGKPKLNIRRISLCNLTCNYNCLKTSHSLLLRSFSHTHLGPMAQQVKNPLAMQELQETWVWSLGQKDSLEEKMATHSSILSWRIPWT